MIKRFWLAGLMALGLCQSGTAFAQPSASGT